MNHDNSKKRSAFINGVSVHNEPGRINFLSDGFYFFPRKLFEFLKRIFFANHSRVSDYPAGYKALKQYDLFTGQDFSRSIGLFEDDKGRKVIVKELFYRFHNLKYHQIINEITVLRLLAELGSRVGGITVKFPRLIDWSDDGRKFFEIREYIVGSPLKGYDKDFAVDIIKQCLEGLKKISGSISRVGEKKLSKRSPRFLRWVFPAYFIQAVLRDLKNIRRYIYFFILFYKLDFSSSSSETLVLAHRDMHSLNIIVQNGKGGIIDFEVSALAEPETDLAIVARYFAKELGVDRVKKIINDLINNEAGRRNFLRLTIFYAIQSLAIEFKEIEFYKCSQDYLIVLEKEIIPDIIKEKKDNP